METHKSLDNYNVYKIKKDNKTFFLGNINNYRSDIENILNNINGLKFDSIIMIFGLDTGEYLDEVKRVICERNKIVIIEPNEEIYLSSQYIKNEQVDLLLFSENEIYNQISQYINIFNYQNFYVCDFGQYKEVYKVEYEILIREINKIYFYINTSVNFSKANKYNTVKNLFLNMKFINKSILIEEYLNVYENVPAFIISAGPSLGENIEVMKKNKELLEKSIVIASTRTLGELLKNNIKVDFLVSIDPSDLNYEMIKENLECKVPLIYYEYSNNKVVNEYKGEKIIYSTILARIYNELTTSKYIFIGGSVAHISIGIAEFMGCGPIILVGQDFAYTNNKYHSDSSSYEFENNNVDKITALIEDVNGKYIGTSHTLLLYKERLEEYIKNNKDKEFINVSFGAKINGATHMSIEDLFKLNIFSLNKKDRVPLTKKVQLDYKKLINDTIEYINFQIKESDIGKNICEELCNEDKNVYIIDLDRKDERFIKFSNAINIINRFESYINNILFNGFFTGLLMEVQEKVIIMTAKDYSKLTSNLVYQSSCFKEYFINMKIMLTEVKNILENI